jgi:hypothetical protein
MTDDGSPVRHCYHVTFPTNAEARRILGISPLPDLESAEDGAVVGIRPGHRLQGILCGKLGPPCFHCGGVSEVLCDFPLGEENRTCDRALCLHCAPNFGADGVAVPVAQQLPETDYKNYCHDHDQHGRGMLLFPQPRVISPPGPAPAPARAKPLPKAPPESHRWRVRRVRQGAHGNPPGAVLTGWTTQLEARRFAARVAGYVETWDEFVRLWRTLYPLKPREKRP